MHDYEYLKGTNKTLEGKLREIEGELINLNASLQQYKEALRAEQEKGELMKKNFEEMQAIYNSKVEALREKISNQSKNLFTIDFKLSFNINGDGM